MNETTVEVETLALRAEFLTCVSHGIFSRGRRQRVVAQISALPGNRASWGEKCRLNRNASQREAVHLSHV